MCMICPHWCQETSHQKIRRTEFTTSQSLPHSRAKLIHMCTAFHTKVPISPMVWHTHFSRFTWQLYQLPNPQSNATPSFHSQWLNSLSETITFYTSMLPSVPKPSSPNLMAMPMLTCNLTVISFKRLPSSQLSVLLRGLWGLLSWGQIYFSSACIVAK